MCQCVAMAPKKKFKMTPSMVPLAGTASSMDAVPPVMIAVNRMVDKMYELRHKAPGDDELYPHPVLHGGTFKDIAQRSWRVRPEDMLNDSHRMCIAAGLTGKDTSIDDFGARFLTVKDRFAHKPIVLELPAVVLNEPT